MQHFRRDSAVIILIAEDVSRDLQEIFQKEQSNHVLKAGRFQPSVLIERIAAKQVYMWSGKAPSNNLDPGRLLAKALQHCEKDANLKRQLSCRSQYKATQLA